MTRSKWMKESPAEQPDTKSLRKQSSIVDIHKLYERSVQSARDEVDMILMLYRQAKEASALKAQRRNIINRQDTVSNTDSDTTDDEYHSDAIKIPTVLREDFCGTAIVCSEFVSRSPLNQAFGVDIDQKVIEYAKQKADYNSDRIHLTVGNVFTVDRKKSGIPKADILCALNYGIFYCHTRSLLVKYLRKCRSAVKEKSGVCVFDVFGGADCYESGKGKSSRREYEGFTYIFEQQSFNCMTNMAKCFIHFEFPDGSKISKAFRYDFRVYTIPEVREALEEAGFSQSFVWASMGHGGETADDSEGLLAYKRIDDAQMYSGCRSFNAYIVACP